MNGSGEINNSLPSTRRRFLKNNFNDYCEGSSLHGVKYLVAKDRPWIERCFWIFATVLSFAASLYFINRVWNKWNNSPVIVSFSETTTPVWKIPFPSVTICSETKSRQSVFNFTMYHHMNDSDLSDEEIKKREAVVMTCDPHIYNKGNDYLDQFSIDFMENVASPFDELAWICNWKQRLVPCENLFTPIMTDDGLCITSNTLNHDDLYAGYGLNSKHLKTLPKSLNWDLDNGYLDNSKFETYPQRVLHAGKKSSLNIVMMAYNKDLDYSCRGAVQGFKVLLHNPAEIPRVGERYFRVPLNQVVQLAVKPDIMTASKTLSGYSPYERQCFFQHEKQLKYFKVYTQRNCELECLTHFTLKECGCVSYYMPRSNDTRICGAEKKSCVETVIEKMVENEITSLNSKNEKLTSSCNCLTSCSSIQYDAETSQADFRWQKLMMAYKSNTSNLDLEGSCTHIHMFMCQDTNFTYPLNKPYFQDTYLNLAKIIIYYKESQFVTSYRSELYGYADFLGTCGGLMGFCCGFSILSLIEIIYYATIRLYNNIKNNKLYGTPSKVKVKAAV